MPKGLDQTADKGGSTLARIYQLYSPPDYVKQANFTELFTERQTPSAHCADPINAQFPCTSKPDCWLSMAYFVEKQAEYGEVDRGRVRERLQRFADYHQIGGELQRLQDRYDELYKNAIDQLPDSSFAWVWQHEDGKKDRRLCIHSAQQCKDAADYLFRHRDALPLRHRHVMAGKILDRADNIGAGLSMDDRDFLERQAGHGWGNPSKIAAMLENRARYVWGQRRDEAHQKLAMVLVELAAGVRNQPQITLAQDNLVKLACQIDDYDRVGGVPGHYHDELVPRPEDVIFSATRAKTAADLKEVQATKSGAVYDKSAFSALRVDDLQQLFGDDFVRSVSDDGMTVNPEKMAEMVSTLPRPDAEMLDDLMAENSLVPLMRKAASEKIGMSHLAVQEWAAVYDEMTRAGMPEVQ